MNCSTTFPKNTPPVIPVRVPIPIWGFVFNLTYMQPAVTPERQPRAPLIGRPQTTVPAFGFAAAGPCTRQGLTCSNMPFFPQLTYKETYS